MARPKGIWTQVELKFAPGAEAWFIIRSRRGVFRLPADAAIKELYEGVKEGWTIAPAKALSAAPMTIRVAVDDWQAFEAWKRTRRAERPAL